MHRTQIILIDSDCRRRAKVAYELTNPTNYVLPLEDVAELCEIWPDEAVVLIEDKADNVARLSKMLVREERSLPFIAFAAAPEAAARVAATARGACAYLAWPADPVAVAEAVSAALAGKLSPEEPRRAEACGIASTGMIGAADTRGDYLIHGHRAGPSTRKADNVVAFHALRNH